MENEVKSETRVRMNATMDAKGLWKPDITAESPSVETSRKLFAETLIAIKEEIEKFGGKLVGNG